MRFISGIILIVVAVGLFFGFTNPRYQEKKPVREEVARFDEALDRAKDLTALRDELLAKYNSFSPDELHTLEVLLPDSIDTVQLIIDVNNIAKSDNLTLLNIAVTEDSGSTKAGPDTRQYGTMHIAFNVSTTYARFKVLLADLERSLRILDVDSITFEQPDPVGNTTYTVRARTYWLK